MNVLFDLIGKFGDQQRTRHYERRMCKEAVPKAGGERLRAEDSVWVRKKAVT